MLVLLVGDIVTLSLVTIYGFARHSTLDTAGVRMLATFIPLLAAWFLIAPYLGVFDLQRASEIRQVWRPAWAMLLAAPLFAFLRGLWLNAPIVPLFVLVMGGVGAVALLLWRIIYWKVFSQRKSLHG
jgi:hypothetical protein